jgi:hypothetical protein
MARHFAGLLIYESRRALQNGLLGKKTLPTMRREYVADVRVWQRYMIFFVNVNDFILDFPYGTSGLMFDISNIAGPGVALRMDTGAVLR